jgi:hypothetical protein
MELKFILNAIWLALVMTILGFVILKAYNRSKKKGNEIARMIFFAFLFYELGLFFIFLNTLFEYVFEILEWIPNPVFFPIRFWLQYTNLSNAMLLIGNIFVFRFYLIVFHNPEASSEKKIQYIYAICALIVIILILIGEWYVELNPNHFAYPFLTDRVNRYSMIIILSLSVYVPMAAESLIVRQRVLKNNRSDPAAHKFIFILGMALSFISIFIFAILDALSEVEFSIHYYLTIGMEAVSVLFAYIGLIKEIKK